MDSIAKVATRLHSGALSVEELYRKCLQRAHALKRLNMFITTTEELAQRQADDAAKRYRKGKPKGKLDGVPVAVKDNFSTKDVETTCGSRILQGYRPPYTATVVQRLLNEGAVLMGKTNMDEFAMGSGTVDSFYGPVENIWNHPLLSHHAPSRQEGSEADTKSIHTQTPSYTDSDWFVAGGSSGGSAVAVASGVCFAALGSDTGGSVRVPASYCGVVGLKPTYGLCSRHGLIPLVNSLDVPGVFARTVDDAAAVLGIIGGHDPLDPTSAPVSFEPFDLPSDLSVQGLRVGVPKEFHIPDVESDVLKAWSVGVDHFEKGGAHVCEVSLPHVQYSIVCYSVLCAVEVASNMARYDSIEYGHRSDDSTTTEALYAATRHEGFNDVVRGRILAGNYFLLKDNYEKYFLKAQRVRRLIADDFRKVFDGGVDVLLTPSPISDAKTYREFRQFDNRKQVERNDIQLVPANLAGVPAVTIPVALSARSMPIGLQLIGPRFQDRRLLTVAKWLEQQAQFPRDKLENMLRNVVC